METIYLWLVLCNSGADCAEPQNYRAAYQMDVFDGQAAVSDCDKAAEHGVALMKKSEALNWRMGCATVAQFKARGLRK